MKIDTECDFTRSGQLPDFASFFIPHPSYRCNSPPAAALIGRLLPGVIQSQIGVSGHVTFLLHVLVLRCGSDVTIPPNHRRYHRAIATIKRSSATQAKLCVMTSAIMTSANYDVSKYYVSKYDGSKSWRQQIMMSAKYDVSKYDVSKSWRQHIMTSAKYDVSKLWRQQIVTSRRQEDERRNEFPVAP